MATIEVGIRYDQIVKGTIIKTRKPCINVVIKYIIRTSINLIIRVDMCVDIYRHTYIDNHTHTYPQKVSLKLYIYYKSASQITTQIKT